MVLLGVAFALIVFVVGISLYSNGIFEPKSEPVKVEVLDECSLIMGNLIHNIHDEGGCKIKCVNNCEIRDMKFYNSSFTFQNSSCHECDCYCR